MWRFFRDRGDRERARKHYNVAAVIDEAFEDSDFETWLDESDDGEPGALDDVRLDLKVVDSRVEIEHEEHGLLESLRNLDINVQKEFAIKDMIGTVQFDVFNLLNDNSLDIEESRQLTNYNEAGFLQTFPLTQIATRRSGRFFQAAFKLNF